MKRNPCIPELLCCTAVINTTLWINYTSIKNVRWAGRVNTYWVLRIEPDIIKHLHDYIYIYIYIILYLLTMPKAMVFPVVMYGCESWSINKAEHRRIDAFEL